MQNNYLVTKVQLNQTNKQQYLIYFFVLINSTFQSLNVIKILINFKFSFILKFQEENILLLLKLINFIFNEICTDLIQS